MIGRPSEKWKEKLLENCRKNAEKLDVFGSKMSDSSAKPTQQNQGKPFLGTRRPIGGHFPRKPTPEGGPKMSHF